MSEPILVRAVRWALTRRLVRAYLLYSGARGPMLADSVTYRTLFSLFAAVLLGFSLAALWLAGNPEAWDALVAAANSAIPGIFDVIDLSKLPEGTGLNITWVVSLVGGLLAAIGAIGSLRSAFRIIAGLTHDDTFFALVMLRNLALALGMGAALAAAAVATLLTTAGLGLVTGWLGLPPDQPLVGFAAWTLSTVIVLVLDTAVVAVLFASLSGIKVRLRTLVPGALLGGFGLTVLQQLSGLFVGGAGANPLVGVFASLFALLLWLNLSSQVVLIAGAFIVTGAEEDEDRVRARYGASTLAQYRVRRAERALQAATDELQSARSEEEKERSGAK